jgi:hypothetical protein
MDAWWSYEGVLIVAVCLAAAVVWLPPLRRRFWGPPVRGDAHLFRIELGVVFFVVPMIVCIAFLIFAVAEWILVAT